MSDPRKVIGNYIKTRACLVTNEAECARRYGSRKKTHMVKGVVLDSFRQVNPATGKTGVTKIKASFELGGGDIKEATVSITSVQISSATELLNLLNDGGLLPVPQVHVPVLPDTADVHDDPPSGGLQPLAPENVSVPVLPNVPDVAAPVPQFWEMVGDMRNDHVIHNTALRHDATNLQLRRPQTDDTPQPAASPNGLNWYVENVITDINGSIPYREWGLRNSVGEVLHKGCNTNKRLTRLDIFLMMFPPRMLDIIVTETNTHLAAKRQRLTTKGEIISLFGLLILTTKFEFSDRASLWSPTPKSKYEVAANFGRTKFSKHRFDTLWSCLRFGHQPSERPLEMSSERYRWLLVDTFVTCFNQHRAGTFIPSDLLVADESMSRWYGLGGEWINIGVPMYVCLERKPDAGCEIQNIACGRSGVLLKLKLVKTTEEEARLAQEDIDGLLHGTKVLMDLVEPWIHSNRIVCADSYFASVGAAIKLKEMGLRFIGVVKTATKSFPMAYLSASELHRRGDRLGLISKNVDGRGTDLLAFVWVDRDRRYFIASGSSLAEGAVITRERWRQLEDGDADPELVEIVVPQPRAAEIYYSVCGKIDQHNRDRVDTLKIDVKVETKDWSKRVNLTILSMILVDTWKVYKEFTCRDDFGESQKEFYGHLAAEMLDNTYDSGPSRNRSEEGQEQLQIHAFWAATGAPRAGISIHITPTKRTRNEGSSHRHQGYCSECGMKTTYQCSQCADDSENSNKSYICNSKSGRACFPNHVHTNHT